MLNFHKLNRFVCIKTQKTKHTNKHTCTHIHVRSHQKAEEEQKYFCDVIEFAAYNCGSVCAWVSVFLMPFAKLPENQFTLPNSVTCTHTHTYIQVTHTPKAATQETTRDANLPIWRACFARRSKHREVRTAQGTFVNWNQRSGSVTNEAAHKKARERERATNRTECKFAEESQ